MADRDERASVEGVHTIDFDLLDEKTKANVIECIQRRGKISIVLETVAVGGLGTAKEFGRLID